MLEKFSVTLNEQIDKYEDHNKNLTNTKLLNPFYERIKELRDEITATVQTLTLFNSRSDLYNYFNIESRPNITEIVEMLKKIKERLLSTPMSLANSPIYQQFEYTLCALNSKIDEEIDSAWIDYIESTRPSADQSLLDIIATFEGMEKNIYTIKNLDTQLDELSDLIPTTDEEIDAFNNRCDELKSHLDQLKLDRIPSEVVIFLKAVFSPSGAKLELLSDSVRKWLDENHYSSKFCIKGK